MQLALLLCLFVHPFLFVWFNDVFIFVFAYVCFAHVCLGMLCWVLCCVLRVYWRVVCETRVADVHVVFVLVFMLVCLWCFIIFCSFVYL
jgi:hypothetical protein